MTVSIRSLIPGLALLLVGVISLLLITFADWFVSSNGFSFGWQQFVGSLPSLVAILTSFIVIRARRRHQQRPKARVSLLIGALSGMAAILLALVALERGRSFPYDSTTGPLKAYKKVIKVAGLSDTGICVCGYSSNCIRSRWNP